MDQFILSKSTGINNIATLEQNIMAKTWFNSSSLSNNISFTNLMDITNFKVFGTFTSNGITLFAGANYTDLYHEAWHAFSQMYMTIDQKINLYNSFRDSHEYQNKTYLEVEELLAEDFRKYVLSDSKVILDQRPVRNSIFRKIWNFVKSLSSSSTKEELKDDTKTITKVHELYDQLHKDEIKQYSPSVTNMMFGTLYKGILTKDGSYLSNAESQLISDSVDSIISQFLVKRHKTVIALFESDAAVKAVYSVVKSALQDKMIQPDTTDYQRQLIKTTLDNFKNVIDYHSGNSRKGIKGKSKFFSSFKNISDSFDANGDIIEKTKMENYGTSVQKIGEQSKNFLFNRTGNEESIIDGASNKTMFLLSGLTQLDRNKKTILNNLGIPKLTDGRTMINRLTRIIAGVLDPQDMMDKIYDKFGQYPEFEELWTRLGSVQNHKNYNDFNAMTTFWEDFNYPKIPIMSMFLQPDRSNGDVTYVARYGEAASDTFGLRKSMVDDFQTDSSNSYSYKNEKGQNVLNIQKVIDDFGIKAYSQKFIDIYPNGYTKGIEKSPLESRPYVYNTKKDQKLQFLRAVGFKFSDKEEIHQIVNKIDESNYMITDKLSYILNELDTLYKAGVQVTDPITTLLNGYKDPNTKKKIVDGQSTVLAPLLQAEVRYSDAFGSGCIVNAEGNTENENSLNMNMTITFNYINNAKKYPRYQDLINKSPVRIMDRYDITRNPMIRNSYWLNSMFVLDTKNADGSINQSDVRYGIRRMDEKGNPVTIDITNYNGVTVLDDTYTYANVGVKTTGLTKSARLLMNIESMLGAGVMGTPQQGSKGSSFAYKMSKLILDGGNSENPHLYFSIDKFLDKHIFSMDGDQLNYELKTNAFTDKIFDRINGYLIDEVTRIQWSQKGLNSQEANQLRKLHLDLAESSKSDSPTIQKQIDELMSKSIGEGKNIPGYNRRSLYFQFFDNILSNSTKDKLYKNLSDADPNRIDLHVAQYKSEISKDMTHYFSKIEEEDWNEFQKAPILSTLLMSKVPKILNYYGMEKITKEETQRALVRAYSYNAWIHNNEAFKFVYGDLAFYKTEKEESSKIVTDYSVTGKIPRTDAGAIDYINAQGRQIARSMGIHQKHYDGTADVVILRDNILPSKSIEMFRKLFTEYLVEVASHMEEKYQADYIKDKINQMLKPYTELNEGDAQGWCTLDFYRIYKMSIGGDNWDVTMQKLYTKVANNEILTPEETIHFFNPEKLEYCGPLLTDTLAVPGLHKFSIMPLIPSMIKGTSFEHINRNWMEQDIDYGVFESGSKIASLTTDGQYDKMYDDYNLRSDYTGSYKKNTIHMSYLKQRIEISNHNFDRTIYSAQMRTIIESGLYCEGKPVNEEAERLDIEMVNNINLLTAYHRTELLKETGITENADGKFTIISDAPLVKLLHGELQNGDFPESTIDFIDLDGNDRLKHPLDSSTSVQKIESLLMAIVNNRLVTQRIFGECLIQLSSAGYELNESKDRLNGKYTDVEKADYGTNDLPFYIPEGRILSDGTKVTSAMKIKRAFRKSDEPLLKLTHLDGNKIGTLNRLNWVIKDEKWLDLNDHRKMLTLVGERIPVHSLNSLEFMEVYKFLPSEAGNIIILPSEIVAKSGSNFEIDKLNLHFPNIGIVNNEAILFNKTDGTPKALENDLIDNIRSILQMPHNAIELLRPNSVNIVKPIADALSFKVSEYNSGISKLSGEVETRGGKKYISPTRLIETVYNLNLNEATRVGNEVLGILMVANKFKSLLNKAGAYLQNSYRLEQDDIKGVSQGDKIVNVFCMLPHNTIEFGGKLYISVSHQYDTKREYKSSEVTAQLINGALEVEKDAWLLNVNGTLEAMPVQIQLIEMGTPYRAIADFVTQPAILKYTRALQNKNNLFSKISDAKRYTDYTSTVRKEIFTELLGKKDGQRVNELLKADLTKYAYLFNQEGLHASHETPLEQAVYLIHFIQLTKLASVTGAVRTAMNYDTYKSPNLFAAQTKKNDFMDASNSGIYSDAVMDRLRNKSVTSSFAVQELSLHMWTHFLPLRNSPIVNKFIATVVIKDIPFVLRSKATDKVVRTFKNDLLEYVLQNAGLPAEYRADNGLKWKLLFRSSNGGLLADKLAHIKNKYPDLAKEYPLVDHFVRDAPKPKLITKSDIANGVKNLDVVNIKLTDKVLDTSIINDFSEQFEKLADENVIKSKDYTENKAITQFFEQLSLFGLLQSGLNKSPISWTEIIPQSAYTKLMEQPIKNCIKNIDIVFLESFYTLFKKANPGLFNRQSNLKPYRYKNLTEETK